MFLLIIIYFILTPYKNKSESFKDFKKIVELSESLTKYNKRMKYNMKNYSNFK